MPKPPTSSLRTALESLPEGAGEPIVSTVFAYPKLTEALGFSSEEVIPAYRTGAVITDFALRKNLNDSDIFLKTKTHPFLLIELKGRHINLEGDSAGYLSTVKQLKSQLLDEKAKFCHWGLITNGNNIQLFRKHGKVIFPATTNITLTPDNVDKVVKDIRDKIEDTPKALTISVYNNKGGVGKTTTTINLGATLAMLGKKVLMIDMDWNQRDLSKNLGIDSTKGLIEELLYDRKASLKSAVSNRAYRIKSSRGTKDIFFDVISAHEKMSSFNEQELIQRTERNVLDQKLKSVKNYYDYILLDTPPNWRHVTQLAMFATDVIMAPTRHDDVSSLRNIAEVIKKFIPEVRIIKDDGTPEVLPVFFNGHSPTDAQLKVVQDEINEIISESRNNEKIDLEPYFFPKSQTANKDLSIHHLPNHAAIAGSAFKHIPAVLRSFPIFSNYRLLAEEYFVQ